MKHVHTKTFTQMLITAFFIIAITWKQPKCLSINEWIIKVWYIQTMEYYSVLKRNELSDHEKTGRELKYIFLSERANSEKLQLCNFNSMPF